MNQKQLANFFAGVAIFITYLLPIIMIISVSYLLSDQFYIR